MIKREAKFTTRFIKWFVENFESYKEYFDNSGAIEVKVSKDNRIYKKQFADHQLRNLKMAKHNKVIYKIPDAGWQNPFDIIFLSKSKAYVCVVFNIETSDTFYIIDIDRILDWEAKSLTSEDCETLCVVKSTL